MVDDKKLSDDLVDDKKLSDDLVDDKKLSDDLVDDKKLSDDLVDDKKLSDDLVDDKKLSDDLVDDKKLSDDLVDDKKLSDDLVDDKKLSDDLVDDKKLSDDLNPKMQKVKKTAVVIGVDYDNIPGKKLNGAENDASEVYTILKKNGFEISDDHFLTGEKASYKAISKAISNSIRKRSDYDLVLFYFSGHGFSDEQDGVYIAPYDIDPEDPYVCGIRTDELNRVMDDSVNNSKFFVLLDCCYSGKALIGSKSGMRSDTDSLQNAEIFGKNCKKFAFNQNPAKMRKILLASSQDNQKAFEKPFSHDKLTESKLGNESTGNHMHGVFSYHLIEALWGKD